MRFDRIQHCKIISGSFFCTQPVITDYRYRIYNAISGIISETKGNKTRQMGLSSSVFASANSCDKIIDPLLSRFVVLKIPEYTFREFKEIVMFRLAKEGIRTCTAERIANSVWLELKSRNVRDAIKISRLATKPEDIEDIVKILKNYKK